VEKIKKETFAYHLLLSTLCFVYRNRQMFSKKAKKKEALTKVILSKINELTEQDAKMQGLVFSGERSIHSLEQALIQISKVSPKSAKDESEMLKRALKENLSDMMENAKWQPDKSSDSNLVRSLQEVQRFAEELSAKAKGIIMKIDTLNFEIDEKEVIWVNSRRMLRFIESVFEKKGPYKDLFAIFYMEYMRHREKAEGERQFYKEVYTIERAMEFVNSTFDRPMQILTFNFDDGSVTAWVADVYYDSDYITNYCGLVYRGLRANYHEIELPPISESVFKRLKATYKYPIAFYFSRSIRTGRKVLLVDGCRFRVATIPFVSALLSFTEEIRIPNAVEDLIAGYYR
jgi:hypothetical protein